MEATKERVVDVIDGLKVRAIGYVLGWLHDRSGNPDAEWAEHKERDAKD